MVAIRELFLFCPPRSQKGSRYLMTNLMASERNQSRVSKIAMPSDGTHLSRLLRSLSVLRGHLDRRVPRRTMASRKWLETSRQVCGPLWRICGRLLLETSRSMAGLSIAGLLVGAAAGSTIRNETRTQFGHLLRRHCGRVLATRSVISQVPHHDTRTRQQMMLKMRPRRSPDAPTRSEPSTSPGPLSQSTPTTTMTGRTGTAQPRIRLDGLGLPSVVISYLQSQRRTPRMSETTSTPFSPFCATSSQPTHTKSQAKRRPLITLPPTARTRPTSLPVSPPPGRRPV